MTQDADGTVNASHETPADMSRLAAELCHLKSQAPAAAWRQALQLIEALQLMPDQRAGAVAVADACTFDVTMGYTLSKMLRFRNTPLRWSSPIIQGRPLGPTAIL